MGQEPIQQPMQQPMQQTVQQPMQQPMQQPIMMQQPMQPQPTGIYPQLGSSLTPAYPPPGGTYPQLGVTYPQLSMPTGGQTRDFSPQQLQAVGAPRVYHTAIPIMSLTQGASPVDCPSCRQRAMTRTEFQAGSTTHLWAIILCLFTGLACIPYLMNSSKDVKHSCGNCGVHLATWNRGGGTEVFQHS